MKKKRPLGPGKGFVTRVIVRQEDFPNGEYPFNLPCLTDLKHIDLNPKVTFFVGENGSGKSTLLEAIAVAAGMNAEGGGKNFRFATYETHTHLSDFLTLARRDFPQDTYFLRAEPSITSHRNCTRLIERHATVSLSSPTEEVPTSGPTVNPSLPFSICGLVPMACI